MLPQNDFNTVNDHSFALAVTKGTSLLYYSYLIIGQSLIRKSKWKKVFFKLPTPRDQFVSIWSLESGLILKKSEFHSSSQKPQKI